LFFLRKKYKFANNKQQFMKSKKQILFPKHQKIFDLVGENIKLARKRRKLTTIQVAERADINRATLYQIEKGNPGVSMGAYFNVLRVLGLQDDFLKLAADDELGRKLQDLELLGK
jgi:transcriptional regulator with XRE-family HTH domain